MADEQTNTVPDESDPDLDQAELAHSIIASLLDHTRVVSDLIAVMAQALDQETTKALTQTAQWQSYLESRRKMERTREDVKRFVKLVGAHPQTAKVEFIPLPSQPWDVRSSAPARTHLKWRRLSGKKPPDKG
ncbi:MAG TPA: hypothetical protein VEM96_03285 [Pyrinomonadaceae bacterium]|nr:hypothetical protein [Pyrinomonadaceae bacterium]